MSFGPDIGMMTPEAEAKPSALFAPTASRALFPTPASPLNTALKYSNSASSAFASATPASAPVLPVRETAGIMDAPSQPAPMSGSAAASPSHLHGLHATCQLLAQAAQHQALYQCDEAIACLQQLPRAHYLTGFALTIEARCLFETTRYAQAAEVYARLQRLEPWRCDGLAQYSSALWHLRRDTELAALAQRLQASHRLSPDACIATGNCFSLQKDHESALKFFRRAIQLDPHAAYAHTLTAHEHAASDDFDKAVVSYRHALRIDERHYNAWYGLGNLLFRQEKHQLAVLHFQRAIQIHPRSSVLHCFLGMILHACKQHWPALTALQRAVALEVTPSQARFQLATVYLALERYADALRELHVVRSQVPREAAVHFLLGKIHRQQGQRAQALQCFNVALDLDPKDRHQVKALMDKLHLPVTGGDDDGDDDDGILHDSDIEQSLVEDPDEADSESDVPDNAEFEDA